MLSQGDLHSALSVEVSAPHTKWGGEDLRLNLSNLPIRTKTCKSLHTFVRLRNAPYPRYRNANKIEIPFSKLSTLANSQSVGGVVLSFTLGMTWVELPLVMCCLCQF